jgi:hypothetical protein
VTVSKSDPVVFSNHSLLRNERKYIDGEVNSGDKSL